MVANQLIEYFVSPIRDSLPLQALIIAVMCFMFLDVLFGGLNAAIKGEFKSKIMREGLVHKASELGIIFVCIMMDGLISAGVDLSIPIDGMLTTAVSVCLLWMELMSLMEIWAKMNPKLANTKFFRILESVGSENDD